MHTDLCGRQPASGQRVDIGGLRGGVELADEVRARRAARPAFVQAGRHGLQLRLVAAVVANQHDVGEAMLAKALRRAGQHALEGGLWNRDGAGKAHVLGRRGDVALRHIGQHRGDQRIA